MIKTHDGPIGETKEVPPLATTSRGRQLQRGEITKTGRAPQMPSDTGADYAHETKYYGYYYATRVYSHTSTPDNQLILRSFSPYHN